MSNDISARSPDPAFRLASATGGLLAIRISIGLLISLPLRGVEYNTLNLFTTVAAILAGVLALRGSRCVDGAGVGWALTLLILAILPAIFGWVALLYLPSLVLLTLAAARYITASD